MAMMQVGVKRVPVNEPCVPMSVAMRLSRWVVRAMLMLVMIVMEVAVFVFKRVVHMIMFMPLCQMEP
jgi:hypothetical protein